MNLNVLPTADTLQTQFDYLREEVMKNYPLHVALSDFTKNPYSKKVISDTFVKALKTQLETDIDKYHSVWEQSVDLFLSSLKGNVDSYFELFPQFEALGETYKVQYRFEKENDSKLRFTLSLPNSTVLLYSETLLDSSTELEFLNFMRPYLVQLPYYHALGSILDFDSNLEFNFIDSNDLDYVTIKNTKTGAKVEIMRTELNKFKVFARYLFTGDNKSMHIKTSQDYYLDLPGVDTGDTVVVSKLFEGVPLPWLVRVVIDILGELPVYGEKLLKGSYGLTNNKDRRESYPSVSSLFL